MQKLPFVSIVVPFYNSQTTLEKCISSLLKLNFQRERYEIILVNDCSTDNSVGIANKFAELYPNHVKVVDLKKRTGVMAARNEGILRSKGEIIACTDADCIVHPKWLRAMVSRFNEVEAGGVRGKTLPIGRSKFTLFRLDAPVSTYGFRTCNIAYRRDVLFNVGLFDERFSPPTVYHRGDADLAFRVLDKGFKIIFEPEAKVFHPIKKGIRKIYKWGLKHRFDALLYKKHPVRARELLGIKLAFITSWGLAFSMATFSLLLLAVALYFGNILLQILSVCIIALEYTITFLRYYRHKGIIGLISPIALYVFLLFCQISRLYGSLKYKKLIF
ncbi:MAG: glycosyltransferase [Candidatus Bathyarchaeia archaeon]